MVRTAKRGCNLDNRMRIAGGTLFPKVVFSVFALGVNPVHDAEVAAENRAVCHPSLGVLVVASCGTDKAQGQVQIIVIILEDCSDGVGYDLERRCDCRPKVNDADSRGSNVKKPFWVFPSLDLFSAFTTQTLKSFVGSLRSLSTTVTSRTSLVREWSAKPFQGPRARKLRLEIRAKFK